LEPGTLAGRTAAVRRRALASGAIQPIATERERVEDQGVRFLIHVLAGLERKQRALLLQGRDRTNPFLPYDPALYIADLSTTHVGLLNKFEVIPHHLLIVTRAFEEQRSRLTAADFAALAACVAEIDGLGFYNAGRTAGASQRHKHLQLVPLPIAGGPEPVPMEARLRPAVGGTGSGTVPELPFCNAAAGLGTDPVADPRSWSEEVEARYRELLETVGDPLAEAPYNLLVTRRWMLLVPRGEETWRGMSVNALGFAGSLLVRDRDQLEAVRRHGPMRVLAEVARQRG